MSQPGGGIGSDSNSNAKDCPRIVYQSFNTPASVREHKPGPQKHFFDKEPCRKYRAPFLTERTGYMKNKVVEYLKMYLGERRMRVNRQRLINNINQNWVTKNCPMCGHNDWTIDTDMMAMVGIGEDKSIQLGGKITPVVSITCRRCGNTVLINPLAINCTED